MLVNAQAPASRPVQLTWLYDSAQTPGITFNVYRWTSTDTNPAGFTKMNATPVTTVTPCTPLVAGKTCFTYTDPAALNGKLYSYHVTAVNTAGTESGISNEVDVTIVIIIVSPPTGLTAKML